MKQSSESPGYRTELEQKACEAVRKAGLQANDDVNLWCVCAGVWCVWLRACTCGAKESSLKVYSNGDSALQRAVPKISQ